MSLPPGWVIQQPNLSSRYFYHCENEKIDTWIRPSPPPGYTGDWPPLFRASHILVKFSENKSSDKPVISKNYKVRGRPVTRTKTKALQKIQSIREEILSDINKNHCAKFYQCAQKYSDCASSANGGDLGWNDPKVMRPEFMQAVFLLNYGEISEPFLSPSGWHIAIRTDGTCTAPTSLFQPQFTSLDAPDFELEFLRENPLRLKQLAAQGQPVRILKQSEKSETYKLVFMAEANHTEESYKKLIQNLISINAHPDVIYTYIKGFIFYHPTNLTVFDECHDLVAKILPSNLQSFENSVLEYTCNPTYWKKFCNDKKTQFRKVGFTFNFAGEWVNYIKGIKDDEIALQELMHALTSGIIYSDDLLKLAHEKMESPLPQAAPLRERVFQIDINKILEVIQRDPLYKQDFNQLIDRLIGFANQIKPDEEDKVSRDVKILYDKIVIATSHSRSDVIISYLNELRAHKEEFERRRSFEKEHTAERSEISRNLFTGTHTRTMITNTDEPRYRRWMDYLEHEKQMNQIICDEEFYNDLIDFSYRLALTELWWIPSIWMKYWEFLHETRPEEADAILQLAQNTFQNNALFELERADVFISDGNYEQARNIYKSLMTRGEPLLTAAMTLDFKCAIYQEGEEAAFQSITDRVNFISPEFIMNIAKMCSNPDIAWAIYQLGLDNFRGNTELTLAAAEFLSEQRDMRNARLLLQQRLADMKTDHLIITKKLFEFELEHLAPPDHLNETQKMFNTDFPFIQYMHRYRFKDLYPLSPEELNTIAYLNYDFTIDYPKVSDDYVTVLPPHNVSLEKMKKRQEYVDFFARAYQQFSTKQPKTSTDPTTTSAAQYPRITDFEHQLNGLTAPILDIEQVIQEILACKLYN